MADQTPKERLEALVAQEQVSPEALRQLLDSDPEISALLASLTPVEAPFTLPRLNPLAEAALIERAQFDGDIPEYRTGPLPKGVAPAVPVTLTARNPVAGGVMLEKASALVRREVTRHEAQRLQAAERMVQKALPEMEKLATALTTHDNAEALVWGSAATDLPTYQRGSLPAPRKVKAPSGAQLAKLTPEQSKEAAWKLLSTTQGRRSARPVIEDIVLRDLQKQGWTVVAQSPSDRKDTIVSHEWVLPLSGKRALQPAFSFIDMAGKVLAAGLRAKLPRQPGSLVLEVDVINRIADRMVGWSARLLPQDP